MDSVTSVMIGTQLQHVRSFIIDGWPFSSPVAHLFTAMAGGRGPGQTAAASSILSSLELKLEKAERICNDGACLRSQFHSIDINQISAMRP